MDFSFLYSTRIEKTFDDDQAQIVDTFKELLKQGKLGVSLINYYKGLPLSYPATIESVPNGTLELDIHPQQAVAIDKYRYAFIRCPAFPHVVGAHVLYVNIRKQAATLKNFFFAEILAERRNAIRLELEPPTDASFLVQDQVMSGRLLNLSMNGVALSTDLPCLSEERFETTLQFNLPNIIQNNLTNVKTPAQYMGSNEHEGVHVHRFAMTPDKVLEQQISQYIFQRQVEIIRELKEMSA
jgi:hypothetical protein